MPRSRHSGTAAKIAFLALAAVCLGAAGPPARAAAAPGARSGWPPDPSLVRYPEEIHLPAGQTAQEALRRAHPGARDFLRGNPGWQATIDPLAGGIDRAFGDGLELPSGPSPAARAAAARGFLSDHAALWAAGIGGPAGRLVYDEGGSRTLGETGARVVRFGLEKDGLPVLGAGVTLGLRDDRVTLISTSALAPVAASSHPGIGPGDALASVGRYAGGVSSPSLATRREASLAFYPRVEARGAASVLAHRLVWIIEVKPEEAPLYEWYIAWVDAGDGEVLAFFPEASRIGACSPDPARATATVSGGVRPNAAVDPETMVNFPFSRVTVDGVLTSADLNGRFPYTGGTVSSLLTGDHFKVHCDNCTEPLQPTADGDEAGDIDFGTGGSSGNTPVFGNGTSTPADRSTYYHLNNARLLLDKWDNALFDGIEAFVNIQDYCNAYSSSYMLGFFISGAGCRNTGEIRDVVQHELGHTWDRFDGNGITNGGMSEWKGDTIALLFGGDSCVAESFKVSGGPSATCDGVRDLDEKAAGRTDHPSTPAVCPTCATLTRNTNNCGTGVHCLGEIAGQATWHLLQDLLTGNQYISGNPLPGSNPALAPEQARWLMERLLIGGGAPMRTWDPNAAGLSAYDAIMLVDDEDANLANGTPHAAYINEAFGHHGIAESPQVADSANCAPLSDPVVTTSLESDPETGLPVVRIDWTPAGGATQFDVLRNTADGEAFLPLARDVTAGPVFDVGVRAGATYRYFVAAVRRSGCATISPGGNIATVVVEQPTLRVAGRVISEVPGFSDGDGLIEPGERVAVAVTLGEIGGAAPATDVTASITVASVSSPATSSGPVSFGTVPAGGTAPGMASYEVFVGPAEPCGGAVHLVLSASGNEGCWQDGFDIPIEASAQCAVTPTAFVEVVGGSLSVAAPGGDADGIPDNCETATATWQVRNNGTEASGPVLSTISSPMPGVMIASGSSCSLPDLAGGATALCGFDFSLGGAAPGEIPFIVTADSASNPAPSVVSMGIPAEADPYSFGTLSYGFDASLEGWSGRDFAVSATRWTAGGASAHSGSTTVSNLCGRLTSPPLLLDPSSSSTLSFKLYAAIEPYTDAWYDRANVHLVDLDTGAHILLTPASGPIYLATGLPEGGLCHVSGENGWAAAIGGFNTVTFDLSAFAGRRVRIEINYNTDEGDNREGIYVDELTITHAGPAAAPADPQPDACLVPEVSPAAAPVPLGLQELAGGDFRLTWEDLGAGFEYNVYTGALGDWYSHAAGPLACAAIASGASCDGSTCTLDEPGAALPPGDLYFLVTGAGFGLEGTSGFASGPAERDPSQNSCAP